MSNSHMTRRKILGGVGLTGLVGGGLLARRVLASTEGETERLKQREAMLQSHDPGKIAVSQGGAPQGGAHGGHANAGMIGEVDHVANGFHPDDILTDFDYGEVSTLPDGRTQREYHIFAANKEIEVAPGIRYPAWTYNGRIPGPTIRCT